MNGKSDLDCYTRPLGRVPSPQVGSGLGPELKVKVLCWGLMVLMNTVMLFLMSGAGANGLRSAREASAQQTMSGGVWIFGSNDRCHFP